MRAIGMAVSHRPTPTKRPNIERQMLRGRKRLRAGAQRNRVRVLSLRSGKAMKLGQVIAQLPPDTNLAEVLPGWLYEQLDARAEALGKTLPRTPGSLLRGEYADLLWQTVSVEDLCAPALAQLWRRRKARSREELRALLEVLRARQPLLIFPEGRHSPDGRIGPLRRGLEILVRDGRPDAIAYIALAYDPLTTGRTRVCAAFTAPSPRPAGNVREPALRALRGAMPLTCGQVVGSALVGAAERGERRLDLKALERGWSPRSRLRQRSNGR